MLYSGTDPESYITEYILGYEDYLYSTRRCPRDRNSSRMLVGTIMLLGGTDKGWGFRVKVEIPGDPRLSP